MCRTARSPSVSSNEEHLMEAEGYKKSSRFRGLCWDKKHRAWRVRIFYEGKQRHVGRFKDDITAARAYDKAAVYLYGSKAVLNFTMSECIADPSEVSAFIAIAKEISVAAGEAGATAERGPTAAPQPQAYLQPVCQLQQAPQLQQNRSIQCNWSPASSSAQHLSPQQCMNTSNGSYSCPSVPQQQQQQQLLYHTQSYSATIPTHSYSSAKHCNTAAQPQQQVLAPQAVTAVRSCQILQVPSTVGGMQLQPLSTTCYTVPAVPNNHQPSCLQLPLMAGVQQQLSSLAVAAAPTETPQLLAQQQHLLQQQYAAAAAAPVTAVGSSACFIESSPSMAHNNPAVEVLFARGGRSNSCSPASSSAYGAPPILYLQPQQQQQQQLHLQGLTYVGSNGSNLLPGNMTIGAQPGNFVCSTVPAAASGYLASSAAAAGPGLGLGTFNTAAAAVAAQQQQFYGLPTASTADILADLVQGCNIISGTPVQYYV